MNAALELIRPDWPAPSEVQALVSTREGGVSLGPYRSLNLGGHVGDQPAAVVENRRRLLKQALLPREPAWLNQVHGLAVLRLEPCSEAGQSADACWTDAAGVPCAVLSADCLPVLFCSRDGRHVAAAHAGWRGLAQGVLEATVAALPVEPAELLAWLGPAIGPEAFEVGEEVRAAFVAQSAEDAAHFSADGGRWRADLFALARARLRRVGLNAVYGGGICTYSDPTRFFSHRRDGLSGRMVSLIWRQA
ncbi:peptidoglycan editing factor PgeF [Stagnimonas aquatica]|uniref:peptidoglycan editing factor PgeF n=1 Tax=Stagnimonas aquatica TaxID=2689987 RepID=UPI0018F51EBE|nr:peptidoglycan editing factor PgeF [Stagnimonas aquatica]